MNQAERAQELLSTLAGMGYGSALVGGLAVSVRARERFTKDIDFAVAVASDKESEAIGLAMQRSGYRLVMVIEQDERKVISTLRFQHPLDTGEEPTVDLLCGSTGIEREIVAQATETPIAKGLSLPVARTEHLIAMKVLSENEYRDQDRGDLRALFSVASKGELERARKALQLIEERGFHRGKDLMDIFEQFAEHERRRQRARDFDRGR